MDKKWVVLQEPPVNFFEEHPELPPVVAHLLYHREIRTQDKIDEFLNPDYSQDVHDPFLFRDMEKAVSRVFKAIEEKEKITIHGDYDADGVSASVILSSLFRALEYTNFSVFLPHRETDGYGLNINTIQTLHNEGTKLIITCDCGGSNVEEINKANELGIDVIITDHHTTPEELPPAHAIIHPKAPGEPYPDKGLAGGGVAFKLMQAILKEHKKNHDELPDGTKHDALEKWQLDMVAIASVADMVPLVGESRTLTKYGLIVLNKTRRTGLQKLLLEARLMDEDGSMKRELDAQTISFRIAPRINAAGRMDHANVAYELLVAQNPTDAVDLAFRLDQNNSDRQKDTEELVKKGKAQIKENPDAPFVFVIGEGWPAGLVGLIASKLKEVTGKPTIVMSKSEREIMGSGRSINGFNMIESLQEMPEYFTKFGGHPMACGFTLSDPEKLESFKKDLTTKFVEKTKDIDVTPTLEIDAEITLEEINWDLYDILQKFEPFGQANPEPTYLARGVTVVAIEPVGKDGKHGRLMVKHKTPRIRKTIGWHLCNTNNGNTNWCKALKAGDIIDLIFTISVNEWNGNRELQLTIKDLRKSEVE